MNLESLQFEKTAFNPNVYGLSGDDVSWPRRLVASCISKAIDDALSAAKDRNGRYILGRSPQSGAVNWIFTESDLFNSFDSFCQIVDIDPTRARKSVYQMLFDKFGDRVAELRIVING